MNKVTQDPEYMGKSNTIGERIGYIRRLRKMKQKDLAKKLGITRNALSQYEQNKRNVQIDMIVKISRILKVPTDYLLGINEIEDYDTDNQNIGNKLGLSSKAIEVLQELKKLNSTKITTIDFLIRQEEIFPVTSIYIETQKNITQAELKKIEAQAFEKQEKEEKKWNDKHCTVISTIDKYFNVGISNEELHITEDSIKKEKDFNTQLQKVLHTKKKINIKEIVNNALLKDIEEELKKAKKYLEGRKQK